MRGAKMQQQQELSGSALAVVEWNDEAADLTVIGEPRIVRDFADIINQSLRGLARNMPGDVFDKYCTMYEHKPLSIIVREAKTEEGASYVVAFPDDFKPDEGCTLLGAIVSVGFILFAAEEGDEDDE